MSPQTGRRIHLALMLLWIVPGIPISWWLKESVPWVVFLSVYAIIVGHASGWGEADRAQRFLDQLFREVETL